MAGRKVFSAGEVLQAADVNDFLMDQSVMVFAGTAARGSAIPSPTEGMVTYLSDSDEVQVYTTTWENVGVEPGLDFITSQTFTGVASVSLNNVFTSKYDTYRIVLAHTNAGTTSQQSFRFRRSGTDDSTANYYAGYGGANIGTGNYEGGPFGITLTSIPISRNINASSKVAVFDVFDVQSATRNKVITGTIFDHQNGTHYSGGGNHVGVAADGFSIITSTGTFAGEIAVYGYRKA